MTPRASIAGGVADGFSWIAIRDILLGKRA